MSTAPFTHADLKRILVERIGLSEADVPDDGDVLFADLGLDSLAVVEIQLAVQQLYGFTIPDEDAGTIRSSAEAIDYVNGRLAAPEAV
jgi:acyl carrier protein